MNAMKQKLSKLIALTLCAVLLCSTGFATVHSAPDPILVWGNLTKLTDGGLMLETSDGNAPYQEIILHGESILFWDASENAEIQPTEIADGQLLYAYINPNVTKDQPPQATAYAVAVNVPEGEPVPAYNQILSFAKAPLLVWGTLSKQEDGGLRLKTADETSHYPELVLHGESILYIDAVTGMPMSADELREGETVYAYINPSVVDGQPPRATAYLILADIPADYGVPLYYQITNHIDRDGSIFTTDRGEQLSIPSDTEIFPYDTKEEVSLDSLIPGDRLLVWNSSTGDPARIMVFPYEYRGYLAWNESSQLLLNNTVLEVAFEKTDDGQMLPIRAVAEALGLEVAWNANTREVTVTAAGETLCSLYPDRDAGCMLKNNTTYVEAEKLAALLDLYLVD